MRKLLLAVPVLLLAVCSAAQDRNFWSPINESTLTKNVFANRFKPAAYKLFQLQEGSLFLEMLNAPHERNVPATASAFIISVPNSTGQVERFRITEAPVMHEALAVRYPGIKSYAGQGIDDPASTIRFDISPRGFHGMIFSPNRKTVYIDPVDRSDKYYVIFSREDIGNYQSPFQCLTESVVQATDATIPEALRNADDARLRTYRLALAASGEYSTYFLNGSETSDAQRKAKVLAAMNTAMTRTNGIYERDFGIRMVLIPNNDAIIYLNASTDPWTTNFNSKTQQTIDAVIGNANYDIGHLVHRAGNNGNAGCIGCVCKTGQKGSAFTSHTTPEGDPFVVDYLAHEMGHQFGGNHTFAHSYEGTIAQCEPGSGSTIMGYAGITGSNTDIQPHSDDYFHSRSIEQITNYIKLSTGGAACAQVTLTGNNTPTANAGADFTIPRSTPFTLTGTGSDADAGDALTYMWEQINQKTSSSPTTPSATATAGPNFRSFTATTSTARTFPALQHVLNGTNTTKWEVLPSVGRTLAFRFTVLDNHPGGGNNRSDDMNVVISGTAGPFAVTAPNTAVSWSVGSSQTVNWSVNSTNASPVNCANVAILLSTDGGNTFPITLLANTPNDGSQSVTVPNNPSSQCRVKVAAVGNIFFDISNVNFTISGTPPACSQPGGLSSSNITTSSATVSWTAVSGAVSYDVDYKLTTSGTWTNAVTGTTSTSANLGGLASSSNYDWRVRTNCSGSSSAYSTAQFTTQAAATCNAPGGLNSSSITHNSATVSWTAVSGALSYDVDYKQASSGTWTNAATATTSTSVNLSGLSSSTLHDWRVRTNCSSLSSSYTAAQFTTQAPPTGCLNAYEPNGTQATAATVSTNTAISAAIGASGDIDYYRVTTTATSNFSITLTNLPGDYDLFLYNSSGTQIGASESGGTTSETINYNNAPAGTYYVRVIGWNGAFSTTVCYSLNIGSSTVTSCQSSYDVSTNGTASGAALIPKNTDIKGLISPSGDNDYYRFTIATGGTATITLTTLPGDYDIRLYRSNGTSQLAISQNGGTSSETITRTYTAGTYYVRVYGYNGANSATQCYTLRVATGTATRNEDLIVTKTMSVFPNPATGTVNVAIEGNEGVSAISVFDIYGKMVMQKTTNASTATLNVSKLAAGVYMVRVSNKGKEISTAKFVKE